MLESYIAPLFMGYVDKYIKNLKPSDLSLSLWGGDVVLQNLELNLDVLQQELNLPVKFLSGKIYKLQIHVPWTRLVYDPVVITIDTMEFVVKLKDSSDAASNVKEKTVSEDLEKEIESARSHDTEQLPPGYVQSILNKVINNVSFKINNIIIKYVEDDIVFSLNVKSVDFYSSDENWQKAFIELTLPELLLRKVCDITDVTICLDQQNSTGRIELYQDPVLYKCNLTCRILSRYKGLSSTKPVDNNISIYCESFDFSLTDHQIPMVIRLLNLVSGLFYGTLDLPGCNIKQHTAPKIIEDHKKLQSKLSATLVDDTVPIADTSWSSWAWSMVPGTGFSDEQKDLQTKEDAKTTFGIYVTQTTVTLKKTNQSSEFVVASQRLEFEPVMCFEFSGCVLEFVSLGDLLIDVNVGVQRLLGYAIGKQCVCTQFVETTDESFDEEIQIEDEIFVKAGVQDANDHPLQFLKRSLFATYIDNEDVVTTKEDLCTDGPKGTSELVDESTKENLNLTLDLLDSDQSLIDSKIYKPGAKLSEMEITTRYGAIFMNYFYEMTLPIVASGEIENIFLYPEMDESVPEVSEKRIHVSTCQLFVSTKFVHGMKWLTGILLEKPPPRKMKSGVFLDPFVLQQLRLDNLLSRKTTISLSNSELYIMTNDHEDNKYACVGSQDEKEAMCLQIDSFSMIKVDPMYTTELLSMVEKGKLVKLNQIKNLNSHIDIKVDGFQAGVSLLNQDTYEAFSLMIVQPTDVKLHTNLSIMPTTFESETPIVHAEYDFICENISLMLTKVHAMLVYEILSSWSSNANKQCIPSLVNSVFHSHGGSKKSSAPLMNIDVKEFSLNFVDAKDIQGISASLTSINATIQSLGDDDKLQTSLLFQSPCNTLDISDVKTWLPEPVHKDTKKYLELKVQYQKDACALPDKLIQMAKINISGASVNFDQLFLMWLSYQVDFQTRRRLVSVRRQGSTILNQSITTPRRSKSYARVFGGSNTSPSHHSSKEKEKVEKANGSEKEDEKEHEIFGEWLAEKINFFKSFHIQVDIEPLVLIFPKEAWPQGYHSMDHIKMISTIYQFNNKNFPSTLMLCLPRISIDSSDHEKNLFSQALPIFMTHKRRRMETLPWTIASKDFAAFSLFPNMNQSNSDGKIETMYICKPISWNLFLASASPNKSFSRKDSTLGIISEHGGDVLKKAAKTRTTWIHEKHASTDSGLGFVLHMDWSICEMFLSQNQLKLGSLTLSNIYQVSKSLDSIRSNAKATLTSAKDTNTSTKESTKPIDLHSVSTSSIVDHVDAFSTLTGSSSVFPKQKVSPDDINVSLWIQCTIPKIKCTFLSEVKHSGAFYQVVSEIEEIMFAFDYQDNVLELTNKIASCLVYYSLLRFDQEPKGWVVMDDGYLLCQKEKFKESEHPDSKTLLSIIYRRTYQLSQSILSPEMSMTEEMKKTSDIGTATSTATIQFKDEHIVKHEVTVHSLSFDLIWCSQPLLSSLGIFMDLLPSRSVVPTNKSAPVKHSSSKANSIMTLPLLMIHCDSVRVILPVGEMSKETTSSCIDQTESVFLFHFHSVDLNSSPSNPITKTVTDKVLYRHTKMNHRETLKKLKLWNVQYQLDIMNVGLCTTNWKSLEGSLPSKYKQTQNPALEWNSQSSYTQQLMTPIFPGFDFKATVAPPIILRAKDKLYPVTAAAFEFHSPREVKLFISSDQIALGLQAMNDINSLITELTELFQSNVSKYKQPLSTKPICEDITVDSGVQTKDVSDYQSKVDVFQRSMPSIELFASVSCISIILYHKKYQQPLISTIYPAVYLSLLQPTCSITTLKEKKALISLLEVSVLTSSNFNGINGQAVIPSLGDFNAEMITCGKGIISEKTGLPSTFLNVALTLENKTELNIDVRVGKPLYLKYYASLDKNLQMFCSQLISIVGSQSSDKDLDASQLTTGCNLKTTETQPSLLDFKLKRFSLYTQRFHISASASCIEKQTSANMQYQTVDVNFTMGYCKGRRTLQNIHMKSQLKGFEVYFTEAEKRVNMLMPLNCELDVLAELCAHSGNVSFESFNPRFYVWYNCKFAHLKVCQHLYNLIKATIKEVQELMQPDNENGKEIPPVDGSDVKGKYLPQKEEAAIAELQTSVDDLRNGQFEYIVQDDDSASSVPDENQILFTSENKSPPMMTWKYPEARTITDITVLPVPFHFTNEARSHWIQDTDTIPCLLEYWDELSHSFIICEELFLSENDSTTVKNTKSITDAISQIWRIVVVIPEEIHRHELQIPNEENITLSPVPAASLAACMKVNSLYAPSLVPSLQMKLSIEAVDIIISNSMSQLGKASPNHLSPFYIEEGGVYPETFEAVKLSFEDLGCKMGLVSSLSTCVNVATKVDMNVMDFNNYCWLNVIVPTEVSINLKQDLSIDSTNMNIELGETDVFVTQTFVHTIKQTAQAWKDISNNKAEVVLFSHYILCNQTQDALHIQQVPANDQCGGINTDEDITLRSGQAYPYSWCSKKNPLIRFCIESVGDWKWSEPIDINILGIYPRKIDHVGHTSQLFVEIKMIGGLQKQIIFHGSCSFMNNLSFDVQMEVITQESVHHTSAIQQNITNVSKKFLLPAGVSRPSLTVSTSFMKSLRVSMCREQDHDIIDIQLLLNQEELHQCIQLKDDDKVYNVWLSLNYSQTILGHLVVSLNPLFILRSHLAEPVLIRIESRDHEKDQVDMVLHGKGRELQIFTTVKENWYNISFCLAGSKEYSHPPYTLNTTQFELLRHDPKNECPLIERKWPYMDTEISEPCINPSGQKVSYKAEHHSNEQQHHNVEIRNWQEAELIFQSSFRWSNLPTVLLDLKPRILIANMADVHLQIKSIETGYIYALNSGLTISPFHIQSKFSVGIQSNNQILWSASITLCNESDEPGSPLLEDKLRPGSFSHCSIFDNTKNHCHQFSLTCLQSNSIYTVCIKKRFMVHNISKKSLIMLPLMLEDLNVQKKFDNLTGLVLPSSTDATCSILNLERPVTSSVPSGLIMNFKIDGDWQQNTKVVCVTEHTVKRTECLCLSEEHLQECINVADTSSLPTSFVLTSSFDGGIIHIFIDDDLSPFITIYNNTSLKLAFKETVTLGGKQRHDVLCTDKDAVIILQPNSNRNYHSEVFKKKFPKTGNTLELNCQLAIDADPTIELSEPMLLQKDTNIKIFVPGHGELFICSFVLNAKLHIEIDAEEKEKHLVSTPLRLPQFELSMTAVNLVLVDYLYPDQVQSLLSVSMCNTRLLHDINKSCSVFKMSLGYLQIDNQLQDSCYNFPVILLPMRQLSERYHSVANYAPFPEIEACLEADFCTIVLEMAQPINEHNINMFMDNVHVSIQPCEMYLEDTFVYRLASVVDSYLPPSTPAIVVQMDTIKDTAISILHPLKLGHIEISELSVLLSIHASIKLFLAADHMPLVLGRFKLQPTQTVTKEFIRTMLYHYATQALVRVGWILGSLEIIGNPTGLIQNIGRGVSDFFVLPYNGLIRGPTAFVSGVSHGMSSFVRHISTGALTSINNLSSSISRNMDRLCFDETHLLMQEERRALSPTRVTTGFSRAFGSLGLSLLGAVAGIVDHPIQNLTTANNTSEAISGVVSGLAKGMVGIVTKPIGGAMEFISQTSQGILQGAGLVKTPERLFLMQFDCADDLGREESQMKFIWQYLHLESCRNILIIPNAMIVSQNDNQEESYQDGVLILTETALFVYQMETSNITSAFPLREVDLVPIACTGSHQYRIQICKPNNDYHAHRLHRSSSLDENPNFRQFFESFAKASEATHTEALCENLSNRNHDAVLEVKLKVMYGDLLLTWCKANKNLLEEENSHADSLEL